MDERQNVLRPIWLNDAEAKQKQAAPELDRRTEARSLRGDVSDAEVLYLSRHDPEAFGQFYDRYYDRVLALLNAKVPSPEVAADLCAETFAAALAGAKRFDPNVGTPSQWLFGIARNKLRHYWRRLQVDKRARAKLGMNPVPADTDTQDAIERVDHPAPSAELLAAIRALPERHAAAVHLRAVDGLNYAEIGEQLGCRTGTARVWVYRGLQQLRDLLTPEIDS